jgi:glycerol-3-phosphate dehydrogenase (NAD(P)+)
MGAGSWGTAFASLLTDAGTDTVLWARDPGRAQEIAENRVNARYLPGVRLPDGLGVTSDAAQALQDADLVVLATPAQTLRANLVAWGDAVPRGAVLASLVKGIELGTLCFMTEVVREVLDVPQQQLAVISGPNLAREIAEKHPAASVVAALDVDVAEALQAACRTPYFRPYTSPDVVGCEVAGALKNIVALAVGMGDGMGYGDNGKAALMTRGLAEMSRVGAALDADPLTFAGLAGLGDLVATCISPLSRNRTFGERLGRGETVAEVLAHTSQTAEGVKSCLSALELARKYNVDVPVIEGVAGVVAGHVHPTDLVHSMMSREMRSELDHPA